MENRDVKANDTYLTKLNAMLPAEVTGLYLFIHSLADPNTALYGALLGFGLVIAILVYFIAPSLLQIDDRITRFLYAITFIVWVCAIEVSKFSVWINWEPLSFVIAGTTAIWTFVVPHIFTAIKKTTDPTVVTP
jgi:hypothetical protein